MTTAIEKNKTELLKMQIQKLSLPERIGLSRKVMLVVPPGTLEESYGRLSVAGGELPMLGLAYIAASLRDQGHIVKIFDYEVLCQKFSEAEADICAFQPDVIGMTGYITNMKRCAKMADLAKSINPDIFVILGGPQVSIFPETGMESQSVDLCVLSEGEVVIRNVMNALALNKGFADIKGVVYRNEKGLVVKNHREALAENLDIFPPPALDLYNMDAYFPPVHVRGRKVAHLLTSRGCPFQCTFCEAKLTFGKTFRYHSTGRVIEELEHLINQGFDSFQFYDDIFTINRPRVKKLCQAIIDKEWKIQWMCWTRTDCVDDELFSMMKKAGCYSITYGAETGNNDLLKIIKKNLTIEKNMQGIRLAKKHKILTNASFMLGLPKETPEHSMKTINFAIESGLDYAVFPILEPYPGTELWEDAKKYGTFDDSGKYRNNLLNEASAVWIPYGRTRKELEKTAYLAMRKFYFRPKQVLRMILNFYHLPLKRALRYIWGGLSFFIFNYFKPSKAGARY